MDALGAIGATTMDLPSSKMLRRRWDPIQRSGGGTFGAARPSVFFPPTLLGCLGDGGAVVACDDGFSIGSGSFGITAAVQRRNRGLGIEFPAG